MKKISIGDQAITLLQKNDIKNNLSFGKINEVYCIINTQDQLFFVLKENKKDSTYQIEDSFELAYLYAIDNNQDTGDIVHFKGFVAPTPNSEYVFTLKIPKEQHDKIPKGIMQKFSSDIKIVIEI